jgi:hypothetical protein
MSEFSDINLVKICDMYFVRDMPTGAICFLTETRFYHIAFERSEDISHLQSKYIVQAERVYRKKDLN